MSNITSQQIIEVKIDPSLAEKKLNSGFTLTLSSDREKVIMKKNEIDKKNIPIYQQYLRDQYSETLKFNALMNYKITGGRRLNANESNYMIDQLTAEVIQSLETWYSETTARKIFRYASNFLPGTQSLKYSQEDYAGEAKIVLEDGSSTAMPFVSSKKVTNYSPVFEFQLGAKFTVNQLEASMFGMERLDTKNIQNMKRGQERAFNNAVFGIATNDPLIAQYPSLFGQLSSCITSSDYATELANWNILTTSASDNLANLLAVIGVPYRFTKRAESEPTKLVMPIAQANFIKTQPLSDNNPVTVAKYILDNTSIDEIIASPECENVGSSSITDALFAFNPECCEVQEVMPFTIYDIQQILFDLIIPSRARSGGLFIYRKAIAFVKNCGA